MSVPARIEIKTHATPEVATGTYSNLAAVGSTPGEFFMDFFQIIAGTADAHLRSRVLMSPVQAKAVLNALADTMRKHEELYGPVSMPPQTVFVAKGGN